MKWTCCIWHVLRLKHFGSLNIVGKHGTVVVEHLSESNGWLLIKMDGSVPVLTREMDESEKRGQVKIESI